MMMLRLRQPSPDIKYTLTVINGTGSGSYADGTEVNVEVNLLNPPSDLHEFDQWAGDTPRLAILYCGHQRFSPLMARTP